MTTAPRIRPMRLGDVAAVADLELLLFPYDAFSATTLRDELALGPAHWWVVAESTAPEPTRVQGPPSARSPAGSASPADGDPSSGAPVVQDGGLAPQRGRLLGAAGISLAEDAEILSLAVAPDAHRRGLGRALLTELVEQARAAGAEQIFLEVAEDNQPALALYVATGFRTISRRRGYYAGPAGPATVDALVLARRPDGRPPRAAEENGVPESARTPDASGIPHAVGVPEAAGKPDSAGLPDAAVPAGRPAHTSDDAGDQP